MPSPFRPRPLLASLLLLVGCSSKHNVLPPGDELEAPAADAPLEIAPAPLEIAPSPAPPDEQALSQAFVDPETAESAEDGASDPAEPAAAPAPAASALSPADARAQAALDEARRLLQGGNAEGAETALGGAADASRPELLQLREQLFVQAAKSRKDLIAQQHHAEQWLLSCGPQRPDTCRAKALRALSEGSPKSERVGNLREADACLQKLEAALRGAKQVPAPPCLSQAGGLYRRMKDRLMEARVALAKGLISAREPGRTTQALAQLDAAERKCDAPRCSDIRRRALKQLSRLYAQENRLHDAARAALRDMAVVQSGLPPKQQPYARTPEVEKRCTALDAKEGPGSCRKLERKLLGRYTFRDFSRERPQEGLSAERVKEVNAHFFVTLEDCLALQAGRLRAPASESYEVRWTVLNDGRVDAVKLGRPDQAGTELDRCFQEQFALWRYPPYRGELQHVEQRFVVNARERN